MSKQKLFENLQLELIKWQNHRRSTGGQDVIIFEGYDGAGKTTSTRKITHYLNYRSLRVVALNKPTQEEQSEWYWARFIRCFPRVGEQTFWDRSYYNRCLVESVMGFCTPDDVDQFFDEVVRLERMWIRGGINIQKFWFNISQSEQTKRLQERQQDPLKRSKLSDIDLESIKRYDEYTLARNRMLEQSSSRWTRWIEVDSTDKTQARIEVIKHIVKDVDYPDKITY